MSFRDPEFCESLEGFIATSTLSEEKLLPKHQVCFSTLITWHEFNRPHSSETASGDYAVRRIIQNPAISY